MGQLRALFVYFQSFQTINTFFTTNHCEKCHVQPVYGAGISVKIATRYITSPYHVLDKTRKWFRKQFWILLIAFSSQVTFAVNNNNLPKLKDVKCVEIKCLKSNGHNF